MNQAQGPVIVTTDGSPRSRRVLLFAAELARAQGREIAVLYVLNPAEYRGEAEIEAVAKKAQSRLLTVLRRAGLYGQTLVAFQGAYEKRVADTILRIATEVDASVIAMDTRGHSALRHAVHGSTALDVLGRTPRPMLLTGGNLGEASMPRDVYRLLVTSDGSRASEAVVRALAPMLVPGRFEVTLLRVHELPPEMEGEAEEVRGARAQLQQLAALFPQGVPVETVVREIPRMGGIDTAIIEEAMQRDVNAIACSTHGTSAARHVVAGSVAMLLLSRSPLPVIMERAID